MPKDHPKLNPLTVPTRQDLENLTEVEVLDVIDRIAAGGQYQMGPSFWIGELTRLRLEAVLGAIASETSANARHVSELTQLTKSAAKLDRRMFWLTVLNVVLAAGAVVSSVTAIVVAQSPPS